MNEENKKLQAQMLEKKGKRSNDPETPSKAAKKEESAKKKQRIDVGNDKVDDR